MSGSCSSAKVVRRHCPELSALQEMSLSTCECPVVEKEGIVTLVDSQALKVHGISHPSEQS